MRIISGKYKGHKLVSFQAGHIRPTTDRVKETLFNKLMGHFESARVLDLFSGTGNLGIEALSREASHVDFVEVHPKSLVILKENLSKLKIKENYKIFPIDVFKYLKRYEGPAFQIILADPPFTEKIADQVMIALSASKVIAPETIIAIESSAQEPIQDAYLSRDSALYPSLILLDRKKFGDKSLSLYQARIS
jgi:16S rRNA (guanine966-N2)-methyltransferase